MAVSSLRCSWRRLLVRATAGVQAELQQSTLASQPAMLPSLLTCLQQTGAHLPATPHSTLLHRRLFSTPPTAAAQAASAPANLPLGEFPETEQGMAAAEAAAAEGATADAAVDQAGILVAVAPRGGVGGHKPGGLVDREVPLLDWSGRIAGTAVLPGGVFDVDVRKDILHRVVRWQLAKRQQGTHKAKTRREVSGGGRKPRNQKGSGKARAGTIRAPQWRGGGKAHGPVVRSHEHDLNRKVRQMGLRCALSAKAAEGRLMVLDSLAIPERKTRVLDGGLTTLLDGAPRRSVLMIDSSKEGADGGDNLRRSAKNLPWVDVLPVAGANVYSMLQRDYLLLSREALRGLVDRATRPIRRTRLMSGTQPHDNVTAAVSDPVVRTDAKL